MAQGLPGPTHKPVMAAQVVQALRVSPSSSVLDCTLGDGGHAHAILEAGSPGSRLLGLDLDPEALEAARTRLRHFHNRVALARASYTQAPELARRLGFLPLDGVLMDLGLSSRQLETAERGFSFQREGPLDMRFDPSQGETAGEVVNRYPVVELARIIRAYGEEPRAMAVARAIVRARPLTTTLELARTVEGAVGRRGRLHPATRVFQALRIAVNRELECQEEAINSAIQLLGPGGRVCVISYHSLEDRIVKVALRRESSDCICPPGTPECRCHHRASLRLVTRRPILPSPEEVRRNPRSRSARLRVAEHL